MFNTTHTLVGLAVGRSGLDKWNRHATWTAVIASNLPDIDVVTGLYDMPAYITHHRGFTHAIAGIPLLSFALAAAMYKLSGSFWRTFTVALLAMSTHPMLDYLNTYGLRPFLPFDETWFYGDALFIIDPVFDCILIAALLASHFAPKHSRPLALAGLLFVTFYVGVRLELRSRARSHLSRFEKAAVSPDILNPLVWIGLIDSPNEVRVGLIDPFRGLIGEPDRIPKDPVSDVARRAGQSRAGAAFHGFARFPVTRVRQLNEGYSVIFFDVRYYNVERNAAFGAEVLFDPSMRIVRESLSFSQRLD